MVLLTLTQSAKVAIDEYQRLHADTEDTDAILQLRLERLAKVELDGPIEHSDLIDVSKDLKKEHKSKSGSGALPKEWRLDTLLKGAAVYQPPPPPKPEPVSKAIHQDSSIDTNSLNSRPNTRH